MIHGLGLEGLTSAKVGLASAGLGLAKLGKPACPSWLVYIRDHSSRKSNSRISRLGMHVEIFSPKFSSSAENAHLRTNHLFARQLGVSTLFHTVWNATVI